MHVEQGTKHPEAGSWHKFTQVFTVVIGYSRNYQIRVIKLIRGSKTLKTYCQWFSLKPEKAFIQKISDRWKVNPYTENKLIK